MPFRSKAQWRMAFAGKIPGFSKEKAHEWAHETKKEFKQLPGHVKKSELEDVLALHFTKIAINIAKPATTMASTALKSRATGAFGGVATQNFLKPPGAAMSKSVINPRRNIANAMRIGQG